MTAGPAPDPAPGGSPEKKGMSGGAKVLIGCVIFLVVLGGAGAVAVGLGARFVSQKAQELVGTAERHAEATRTLQQLHTRYPFEPPADDAVRPERVGSFLSATDHAWEQARPHWEDLMERAEQVEERGRAGVGDVMAGISGVHELTLALADALESQEMSPAEFVWTGTTMRNAYEAMESSENPRGVPAANVDLARQYQQQLAALEAEDEPAGIVLTFATMYGGLGSLQDADWLQGMDLEP